MVGTNVKAIAWVLAGTGIFSLIFASGKFADVAADVFQLTFLRFVGGLLTLLVIMVVRRQSFAGLRSTRPLAHFVRAVFGCYGGAAIIYASANMPIVDATALSLLYVVFVVPLGVVVLKERIGLPHMLGIGLSCLGAGLIVQSRGAFTGMSPAYLWPASIAVLGALLLAFEGVLIRLLSQAERPLSIMLHVNAFGVVLMAIPAFFVWQPISLAQSLAFLSLGPVAIIAQYCILRGYRMASLGVVAPIDYAWLIFASLIGFAFFGEVPTVTIVVGSLIIAAGGSVLALVKPVAADGSGSTAG